MDDKQIFELTKEMGRIVLQSFLSRGNMVFNVSSWDLLLLGSCWYMLFTKGYHSGVQIPNSKGI